MYKYWKLYDKIKMSSFSVQIDQIEKGDKWEKKIIMPNNWMDLENSKYDKNKNGLAFITGKINNIIVIDIDNNNHWEKILKMHNKKEPKTVKVEIGSGKTHLYFKYDDTLEKIKSKPHCFGDEYDINIQTNGGCIICPPSKYYNKNANENIEYKWKRSIYEYKLLDLPEWMKELLTVKNTVSDKESTLDTEIYYNYSDEDIEELLKMLSIDRLDKYDEWIEVGKCIHNITNGSGYLIWDDWSSGSNKYDDKKCKKEWKSFKKSDKGLNISSLIFWCKMDNSEQYNKFKNNVKKNDLIIKKFNKLPVNYNIQFGNRYKDNEREYITINNHKCMFKDKTHNDIEYPNYIDISSGKMDIKCKHSDCYSKKYPTPSIKLTKNELNIMDCSIVRENVTNKLGDNDDIIEFDKFDIFETEELNDIMYKSLSGNDSSLSDIIYHFFKNSYNYGEDNKWYQYNNHRWKLIGSKNDKLTFEGEKLISDLYTKLIDHCKKNKYEKYKIKEIIKIKKNIGNNKTINDVMNESRIRFFVKNNPNGDFVKRLDSNQYLIGFNNGVYDLQNFEFRPGKQTDNITMSMGYDYSDKQSDNAEGLNEFLCDIQPDNSEREYLLTYLSHALYGNMLGLFTILTGSGRNEKSKLIELIKKVFGDYYGSVKSQMFTRPQPDASSPDPGLIKLRYKKIVMSCEPEKKAKLNSGFIKFITRRNSAQIRECHKNEMIEFDPKFITLFVCDDVPEMDSYDITFTNNLRCVHFSSKITDKTTKINQRIIDAKLNEKFNKWRMDFMLILIDRYKKYINGELLEVTENILKRTNQYNKKTEIYLSFLNECTEKSNTHISSSDLYNAFKTWFRNNYPIMNIPTSKDFYTNINMYFKIERVKINNNVPRGIKKLKLI